MGVHGWRGCVHIVARLVKVGAPGDSLRVRRIRRMEVWSGVCFCVGAAFWFYNSARFGAYGITLGILRDTILFTLAGALIQIISSWMLVFALESSTKIRYDRNIIETKPSRIRMKERVLTLDIGNTAAKGERVRGERLLECNSSGTLSEQDIECMVRRHVPECAVSCRVGEDSVVSRDFLERGFGNRYLRLCPSTPLPLDVEYDSRGSLGADRVAAAAGALSSVPVLVVDAGTAVTEDLVADGRFLGGNISPGLSLRFRALNGFTSRLPLSWIRRGTPGFRARYGHGHVPVCSEDLWLKSVVSATWRNAD